MRTYPTVEQGWRKHPNTDKIYAFDKLDGSNIRVEWTKKKRRFWKFGTRQQLINENHGDFGEAIPLIVNKYERDLHDLFVANQFEKAICFFEFFGENSFAGTHYDEPKNVVLFDISVHKKGLLEPRDFLKLTKKFDIPKMLYYGKCNQQFIEDVRHDKLKGMTFEGVVCKGKNVSPGLPLLFKIKNVEWLQRLRNKCGQDEKLFKQLK